MNRDPFPMIVSLLIAVWCVGCNNESPHAAPVVDNRLAEPWISNPSDEWPQIVLTNHAQFNGHTALEGASSFLIDTDDDRILAATAAHLIGSAGGVEPPIPVNELTRKIRSWKMFPRTMPDDFVEAISLGATGLDDPSLDWLFLSIDSADQLPAHPLKPRKDPVRVGETVFLIGCPYVEWDCKQNVYAGVVAERVSDLFRYDIDPPVDLRGFSGAPVIDGKGYVVGVVTIWFQPKMSGENYLEAGGQDIASVWEFLHQNP